MSHFTYVESGEGLTWQIRVLCGLARPRRLIYDREVDTSVEVFTYFAARKLLLRRVSTVHRLFRSIDDDHVRNAFHLSLAMSSAATFGVKNVNTATRFAESEKPIAE